MASAASVLCPDLKSVSAPSLFGRPSSRSYRIAMAQVIRDVKARHRLSNERLAEILGVSEPTVANAENEAGDVLAVTLLNIAYAFGEEAIEPVRQLYLCAPVEQPTSETRLNRIEREINALRKELEA